MAAPGAPLHWRKSARCVDAACVEVAMTEEAVYMRRAGDPDGAVLAFSRAAWEEFLEATRIGGSVTG